jgi:hypothetical protein
MRRSATIDVNGIRAVPPDLFAQEWGTSAWAMMVDEITCPAGPEPGTASFLIPREDFDAADWSGPFDLVCREKVDETATPVTLQHYVLVNAFAAGRIPNSPMVVQVADIRHQLKSTAIDEHWNKNRGETPKTWTQILNEVRALAGVYGSSITLPAAATYTPSSYRLRGRSVMHALHDIASRNRAVLIYDPIAGVLSMKAMAGTQADLTALESSGIKYRPWGSPDLSALDITGVDVTWRDGDVIQRTGTATSGRRITAWGTSYRNVSRPAEATAIANTWFDWGARRAAHQANQYIGFHQLTTGEQVCDVRWKIREACWFTVVTAGAPVQPSTADRPDWDDYGVLVIKAPVGGIPARVGSMLGKASCDVFNNSSSDLQMVDSGENIEVHHMGKTAECVNGDRFGLAGWDYTMQKWMLLREYCDDSEAGPGSQPLTITDSTTDEAGLTSLIQTGGPWPLQVFDQPPVDPDDAGFQSGSGGTPPIIEGP